MVPTTTVRPDWQHLYDVASAQAGMFTTAQAAEAGYSSPLLAHHVKGGKFTRIRHGIYRLVYYPPIEHEELVTIWLWAEQQGVFSHETALALHDLSDALPSKIHITVPSGWKHRRLRVPEGVVMHHSDVPKKGRTWFDAVPVTKPMHTIEDCIRDNVSTDLIRQAIDEAADRELLTRKEHKGLMAKLRRRPKKG